ncbi:MAG TPA: DsrE family protein [Syntrophales bacterium]|nr:DsrE family protein [Syntrophales bacterium]
MKSESRTIIFCLFLSTCLIFVSVAQGFGQEYEALKGLKSVKAVFDVRISNPKSAALSLKLVHDTYKDKNIIAVTKKPAFVVIFIGPSVKLISKNKEGFSPEEQKVLDQIASIISEMSKDGIKLEICLFAAKVFNVDPASVLPGIKHVPNGWVSLIGYEAKGYSLVPAY